MNRGRENLTEAHPADGGAEREPHLGGGSDATRLAGALDEGIHRLGRLGSLADPIISAINLEGQGVRSLGAGRKRPQHLDGTTIATRTRLSDDHVVNRLMDGADAGETDGESHGTIRKRGMSLEKPTIARADKWLVKP